MATPAEPLPHDAWRVRCAAAALVLAGIAAWSNSFAGPFVFDDRPAILANASLDTFVHALSPPRDGGTVTGRPLVNLSLALNRAVGGTLGGYHALNLAIHLCNALVLFGIVRRTVARAGLAAATATGFSAALLWLLHPLQTSAVTYVIQRAEAMMALCALLTLYGFVRSLDAREARAWRALSVSACLAGMACKEVMLVVPFVVLLYDRTFAAGTFRRALAERSRYYSLLAATWLLLGWLVFTNANRAGTAGFGSTRWLDYALTQCAALLTYLRLAAWPDALVFDRGTALHTHFAEVWPQVFLTLVIAAGAIIASRRARRAGFLAASFALVLLPTCVVPIATQTVADHRMYLPLASLATGFAYTIHRWLPRRGWTLVLPIAAALAIATHHRNRDYASPLALWTDTVAKQPRNPRAHTHLGDAFVQAGRPADAVAPYERALQLAPDDAETHNNLANVCNALGRAAEARAHLETAVRLKPSVAASRLNLANALLRADRPADAIPHFAAAAQLGPLDATAHYNYGVALVRVRRLAEASEQFRATVAADPTHVGARANLANVLLLSNRAADAIAEYEAALRLRPDDPQIRANLARARQFANRAAPR